MGLIDNADKLRSEIDEGLERDLRDVLGWEDDEEDDTEENDTPIDENQPEPSQDGEEQQPNTPDTPDDPEIELDGEKIKLSQVRAWRQGHLMLNDYTRKTQELAEQRRQLEQERQLYKQYEQIDAYLRANPQVAFLIGQVLSGQYPATTQPTPGQNLPRTPGLGLQTQAAPSYGQPPAPTVSPTPSVPWQGIDPILDQRLSRLEQSQYDQQLDRTLEQIRAQANAERQKLGLSPLDDARWNEYSTKLMQEAVNSKTTDLLQVFRMDTQTRMEWANEAVEKARQEQQAAAAQRSRQAAGAVMSGSVRTGPIKPSQAKAPKDFSEATRQAYDELRQSGVSLFSSD